MKYRVEVGSFCTRYVGRNIIVNAKNEDEAAKKALNKFLEKEIKLSTCSDPGLPQVDSIIKIP